MLDALERRRSHRPLGERERRGIEFAEPSRLLDRSLEHEPSVHRLVHEARGDRRLHIDELRPVDESLHARPGGMPEDLEGRYREGDADRKLDHPDLRALRRESHVAGARQEATSGHGVPVDRRHRRLGKDEERRQRLAECDDEPLGVRGSSSSIRRRSTPPENTFPAPVMTTDRTAGDAAQAASSWSNAAEKLTVEGVGLSVHQLHDRDPVTVAHAD